jgi:hypothetical protein
VKNLDLEEHKRVLDMIDNMQKLPHVQRDNDRYRAYVSVREVMADAVTNGANSRYYRELSPLNVIKLGKESQCRSTTINRGNFRDIKNSILAKKRVESPIVTTKNSTDGSFYIHNGNHRNQAAKELIEDKLLPEEYGIPSFVFPPNLKSAFTRVSRELQSSLNDRSPGASNNTNDVQKYITGTAAERSIDLSDDEIYKEFLGELKFIFTNQTESALKNNLTRCKNKLKERRSDVWATSGEEFVKEFRKVFGAIAPESDEVCLIDLIGTGNKSCRPLFASTKGSAYDQSIVRCQRWAASHPESLQVAVFACENHKGSAETVARSRANWFNKMYSDFKLAIRLWGLEACEAYLPYDYYAMAPQIQSGTTISLVKNDFNGIIEGEVRALRSHWKLISKKDLLECFRKGKPYELDWVVRPEAIH